MLKNILVHIPSERPIRPIADSAISLAVMRAAHLDAVSIGFETAMWACPSMAALRSPPCLKSSTNAHWRGLTPRSRCLKPKPGNAGITYGLRPFAGNPADIAATVGALARLYDLTVVLQPESGHDTFDNTVPQEILFQSGGPVIFIPYTHKGPFEPKHIGIAWDGSRLAARALRDAAPFLARAQTITIISVNEKEIPASVSAATLATHLARHGLTARIVRMSADRTDIQPMILSIAADSGLDLIVMGGYGHSRLNERILGGVTRGMLRSMTVPTLMSH